MEPEDDIGALARRIAASRGDDRPAAEGLCRALLPRVRLVLLRTERDEATAKDLAQDVMIEVLDALASGRVHDPARITAYARSVCHTAAKCGARTRDRRAAVVARFAADLAGVEHEGPTYSSVDLAALGRCFAALGYRERQTLFMTFMLEQGIEEIATFFDITPGNVRVVRHRAIESLRRCLGVEEEP
jgi:RNA polymerase sigma factor (sigma-70 family)